MPPKHSQRKTSEPRSQRRKPISDEALDEWIRLGCEVKFFTVSQRGVMSGQVLRYDDETIVISPKTYVAREKVISYYSVQNAPAQSNQRPAVR